jgi:hypothetical protein
MNKKTENKEMGAFRGTLFYYRLLFAFRLSLGSTGG